MLFQLEIPKRQSTCSLQGERLVPGMEIYSLLIEEGEASSQVIRKDFCSACWSAQQAALDAKACGYWKSFIEHKKTAAASSRLERALALLKDLLQSSEPNDAEIFVLCLFLAHARQLALRQEFQKEKITYHLYEILKEETFITIKWVSLSDLQTEAIQRSLAAKLQG